jgi:dynein heavy chain
MPPVDLNSTLNSTSMKSKISLLESAIITWTKQIRNVLNQDPEYQLKSGLHPTPDVEIKFWKEKSSNLNSIFEQLQGPKIRRVLRTLDQSKSTYCATFARLCKEVFSSRAEANDNTKYLRAIEDWVYRLNHEEDYPKLMEMFKPMMRVILLIWKNSKHYNTPSRLVVLMREICNSIIAQSTKYVNGEQILAMIESEESHVAATMLKTAINVCSTFKSVYMEYKTISATECHDNAWNIQNGALFMRLDMFMERCHDLLEMTETIVSFSKLSKVEIGGTKGKTLTLSIRQIYEDFQIYVGKFKELSYDLIDVESKGFQEDYRSFEGLIKELEKRLGAVVCLAFDDCTTVFGKFKLFDSFEGLLDRTAVQVFNNILYKTL